MTIYIYICIDMRRPGRCTQGDLDAALLDADSLLAAKDDLSDQLDAADDLLKVNSNIQKIPSLVSQLANENCQLTKILNHFFRKLTLFKGELTFQQGIFRIESP